MYQDKKEQVQNHQKKTPFQVLFCGAHQTFTPPGIDSLRWVWYLTSTFISMREIIPIWISIS